MRVPRFTVLNLLVITTVVAVVVGLELLSVQTEAAVVVASLVDDLAIVVQIEMMI